MKYYITIQTPVDNEEELRSVLSKVIHGYAGYSATVKTVTSGKPNHQFGRRPRLYYIFSVDRVLDDCRSISVKEVPKPIARVYFGRGCHSQMKSVRSGEYVVCEVVKSKSTDCRDTWFLGWDFTLIRMSAVYHSDSLRKALEFARVKIQEHPQNDYIDLTHGN